MDLSFLQATGQKSRTAVTVSILVLMDLSFLPMTKEQYMNNVDKVSILVLMDLPFLRCRGLYSTYTKSSVSILVLMDLPFLQQQMNPTLCSSQRFQSLFLWIFRSY